jgi:hypothetical protein
MTCDDYQGLIIDLARGDAVDRASRDEARRHAALCAQCGAQQQEQQWLTAQFRAIAVADESRHAPERVEIAALAAWRATYAAAGKAQATPLPAARPSARVLRGPWLMSGVAVAGLAAAAMAMLFVWPASHSNSKIEINTPGTVATVARNTESRGGREVAAHATAPVATVAPLEATALAVPTERPRTVTRPSVAAAPRVESALARAMRRDSDEFLPLPYVEPLRSTEARHVVRVSMTSGDEMILGVLPADRRNGQPFEADVLVGEDGIARAIRVVR